jgi:hypothetical protein
MLEKVGGRAERGAQHHEGGVLPSGRGCGVRSLLRRLRTRCRGCTVWVCGHRQMAFKRKPLGFWQDVIMLGSGVCAGWMEAHDNADYISRSSDCLWGHCVRHLWIRASRRALCTVDGPFDRIAPAEATAARAVSPLVALTHAMP